MNGGQLISEVLHANGVRHLFTLCGGHIGPIYVEAARRGIRVWDVRDEASALFAADAAARITGIPGVAAVTAGPGVTNAITAVKNAQLAQSPLLLLGGATATLLRGRGALQDIDQRSLLRSAVKSVAQCNRVKDLVPAVQSALKHAQKGVPGPVFVECPVDLLYPESIVRQWYGRKNKQGAGLLEKIQEWYIERHASRLFSGIDIRQVVLDKVSEPEFPLPHQADIKAVIRALKQAKRPLLLLGSGAMQVPALAPKLSKAVMELGVPFFLSGMARGLVGRYQELQFHHRRKEALREADLILLAGSPCDFRLDYGRSLNRKAVKIAVNRSRAELHKNLSPSLAIQTDPANFLVSLTANADSLPNWDDWKKTLQARDEARNAEIATLATEPMEGINPLALLLHLEKQLPENSTLVVDGGDFAATAAYTLRPRKPLGWLDPGVFGTLGVGGGFALGAAATNPKDYVWIIYGDGSTAYSLAEFETFAKNGLKVCGIVGNNGSWEQIARDQVHLLGADTAVRLPRTDYHKVAQGYGAAGESVQTLEAFGQAVRHAISSMDQGIPYLINAIIGTSTFREGSISI